MYGNIRPCCAWQLSDWQASNTQAVPYNINQQSLTDYINSHFYQDLEHRMVNNQWGAGCRDCVIEEKNNVSGTRQAGEKYANKTHFVLEDMEIKFGNLCNQGCVMCSPMNSSLLESESIKHHIRTGNLEWHQDNQKKYQSLTQPWYDNDERFHEVIAWAARCKQVKFRGGEPTVNTYLQKFLSGLSDHNSDVEIFVNTNGHTFTHKLQQELEKFKSVKLELSIDGYGPMNELIRWPNEWEKLENNVNRMCAMPNTEVSVSSTVQLLNVGEMEPLVTWTKQKPIKELLVNVVWQPDMFRPSLANPKRIDSYRNLAVKHSNENFDLEKIIGSLDNKFDTEKTEKLIHRAKTYLDRLTAIRGIDYKNLVPEL